MATRRKNTEERADSADTDSQGAATAAATTEDNTGSADESAQSAGIVGAGASASGFASDNQGERNVVRAAEGDTLSGPMAPLGAEGNAQSLHEHGQSIEFTEDEQGRRQASAVTKIAVNPSAEYPGRDDALAATDSGRLMPGNLDAVLRAQSAGTQVPGDAQLMSQEEIDALRAEFVDNAQPASSTPGEGTAFNEGDNPNAVVHDNEVDPNTPTQERLSQ